MYIFGHPKSLFTEKWLFYDVQNQDSFSHDVCSFVVQTKMARNTWFHCSIHHTDYHEFVRWWGRSTKRGRACSIVVDFDSRLLSSTLVPALLVHEPLQTIDRLIDNWHIELGVEPMIGVIALFFFAMACSAAAETGLEYTTSVVVITRWRVLHRHFFCTLSV